MPERELGGGERESKEQREGIRGEGSRNKET